MYIAKLGFYYYNENIFYLLSCQSYSQKNSGRSYILENILESTEIYYSKGNKLPGGARNCVVFEHPQCSFWFHEMSNFFMFQ